MAIADKLLKLAGKGDFKLDSAIPTGYVVRECATYGWMLARGCLRHFTGIHASGRLFVGKCGKVRCPTMLTCGSAVRIKEGVYIDALSTDGVRLGNNSLL